MPQKGEYVLYRRGRSSANDKPKLESYYAGPVQVDSVVGSIVYLSIPYRVGQEISYKVERFHVDNIKKFVARENTSEPGNWNYVTVLHRKWEKGTCHYSVVWYDGSTSYAEHSEDLVDNEKEIGIYPEQGIEQKDAQDIADYKKDILGHVYPILINNVGRAEEKRGTRRREYTHRQLSGKTVVWKLDDDEHIAGLAWHLDGDRYLIKFTDGSEETWDRSQVLQKMVGVPGTKVFQYD